MIRSFKWHLQFPLNFPFSLLAESWFCVMATLNFWLTFFPTIVCSRGRQLSQFTPVSRDYSSITAVDSRWACSHLSTKPAVLTNTNKQTKINISVPSQLCWQTQTNKEKHKHLSTKPVVLTNTNKQTKTNISLPSQLCWQIQTKKQTSHRQASCVDKHKQKNKHLTAKPVVLTNTNKQRQNKHISTEPVVLTNTNKQRQNKHISTKPALLTKWLRREESCMLQMWPQPFPGVRALRQYKHTNIQAQAHKHIV